MTTGALEIDSEANSQETSRPASPAIPRKRIIEYIESQWVPWRRERPLNCGSRLPVVLPKPLWSFEERQQAVGRLDCGCSADTAQDIEVPTMCGETEGNARERGLGGLRLLRLHYPVLEMLRPTPT